MSPFDIIYVWSITNYIISSVIHAFWLVLTYDLLEDRRIDDIIIKTFFNSLLHTTNRFQVAVHLFSNRSQRTSKCGKNISDTLCCASCATFLFLPHFDIICDLLRTAARQLGIYLLNRSQAIQNLFIWEIGNNISCPYLRFLLDLSNGCNNRVHHIRSSLLG